jgi:hypothetical protein
MCDPLNKRTLNIIPVDSCNLACPRCCARPYAGWLRRQTIKWDDYLDAIRCAKSHGFTTLSFSGGEPALWWRLPDAVCEAKSIGFRVRIFTNGCGFEPTQYGEADDVRISDYGGVNRADVFRLKNALGRRATVKWSVQSDVPTEPVDGPVRCNGCVPTVVGGLLYGCAVQATHDAGHSIAISRPWEELQDPRGREICRRCLDNTTVRATRAPKFRVLWCIPETCIGSWVRLPLPAGWIWRQVPRLGKWLRSR